MPSAVGGLGKVRAHAERTDHPFARVRRCAKSARPERAFACDAAGGLGRTLIARSVAELGYKLIYTSSFELVVDRRLLLESGRFHC